MRWAKTKPEWPAVTVWHAQEHCVSFKLCPGMGGPAQLMAYCRACSEECAQVSSSASPRAEASYLLQPRLHRCCRCQVEQSPDRSPARRLLLQRRERPQPSRCALSATHCCPCEASLPAIAVCYCFHPYESNATLCTSLQMHSKRVTGSHLITIALSSLIGIHGPDSASASQDSAGQGAMHITVHLQCDAGFPSAVSLACIVSCFSKDGAALLSARTLPAKCVEVRQTPMPD